MNTSKEFFKLLGSIGICLAAGGIGSIFTASKIPTWYGALEKPALNPPSWVFGPVWTTLYILMGISLFLIIRNGSAQKALRVFGLQLALNTLWSIVFFGLESPGWALVNIVLMWLSIVWTIFLFAKISKTAAWLLVPYLAWVSFATYLNYSIWVLN